MAATHTAYVGNLPWRVTEDDVMALLKDRGIQSFVGVRIIQDRDSGRSRGYGFIDCADAEALGEVCRALTDASIDGRSLVVQPAVGEPRRQ